ncbi:MAG: hypothetical protein IKV24_00880, partial [Bacteroidaceae bacterium]|nr:hypothetical protein [Bacteroidaceae bacterium]
DITIDTLRVLAGDGGNIMESGEVQNIQFAIKSRSGDVSGLDKLAFSHEAAVYHTEGGVSLAKEQGIQLSDIVVEISGDIEANLTEK